MPHRIAWSWYTSRWWVSRYIWYNEEGTGRAVAPPMPLLAIPNVTAHLSTAGVPITVLQYSDPLLCGFNMRIKGLSPPLHKRPRRRVQHGLSYRQTWPRRSAEAMILIRGYPQNDDGVPLITSFCDKLCTPRSTAVVVVIRTARVSVGLGMHWYTPTFCRLSLRSSLETRRRELTDVVSTTVRRA